MRSALIVLIFLGGCVGSPADVPGDDPLHEPAQAVATPMREWSKDVTITMAEVNGQRPIVDALNNNCVDVHGLHEGNVTRLVATFVVDSAQPIPTEWTVRAVVFVGPNWQAEVTGNSPVVLEVNASEVPQYERFFTFFVRPAGEPVTVSSAVEGRLKLEADPSTPEHFHVVTDTHISCG